MPDIVIVRIEPQQTLSIRQTVLWPEQPVTFSQVEGDESAHHYGAMLDGELVSVASIFPDGATSARLRKFATLSGMQGQGIGSKVLEHIFQQMRGDGFSILWCDGREQARAFYERLGFKASGEQFFKKDIAYFKMTKML